MWTLAPYRFVNPSIAKRWVERLRRCTGNRHDWRCRLRVDCVMETVIREDPCCLLMQPNSCVSGGPLIICNLEVAYGYRSDSEKDSAACPTETRLECVG